MPDYDNIELSFVLPVSRVAGSHFSQLLAENRGVFLGQNILMPSPELARNATLSAISQLRMLTPVKEVREQFFQEVLEGHTGAKRIVLFAPSMMGTARNPFNKEMIFPVMANRLAELNKIFGSNNPDYFFGLRNPAGLLTSLFLQGLVEGNTADFSDYVSKVDLNTLRWSASLEDMVPKLNAGTVHFWRYEDYPNVAVPLFQKVTGLTSVNSLHGSMAPTNKGMNAEGAERFWEYLSTKGRPAAPDDNVVFAQLCAEFPSVDPMQDDYFLPRGLRENIQFRYDDDCYYLGRLENAQFIEARQEKAEAV